MLVLGVGRKEAAEQRESRGSSEVTVDPQAGVDDWVDPRAARPDLFSSERQTARMKALERLGGMRHSH